MFVSAREGYQPGASASYPTMPTIEIQPQKFSAGGEHSPVHRAETERHNCLSVWDALSGQRWLSRFDIVAYVK
jgi:hypothetical protein